MVHFLTQTLLDNRRVAIYASPREGKTQILKELAMAVNLLEEDRLVYHDLDGDTLEVENRPDDLYFRNVGLNSKVSLIVVVNRDAVETLRDSLTCWLETGKLR